MMDELLNRRNEFWMLYGQFILSLFVIVCVTILLLTGVISAEAGLPILSGQLELSSFSRNALTVEIASKGD